MQRLALLLVVPLAAGCFASSGPGNLSASAGHGTVRTIPIEQRGEPITLSGVDLDGDPLAVPARSTRGTVLNIWWSGCAECRLEAPALRDLASAPDRRADFYGINVRESGRAQAKRFEERHDIPYPSFYDPGGELLLALHGAVPYAAIPTTVVLDQDMRVGAVIMGAIPSATTLRALIASVDTSDRS